MKRTLLRVVQDTSRYLAGFNVDSVFDTDESLDIAYIAERMYYLMCQRYNNVQFTGAVGTLEAYVDPNYPTYMTIPENVQRIQNSKIQYNAIQSEDSATVRYKDVQYVAPEEFLRRSKTMVDTMPNTAVVNDPSGVEFVIRTDKAPDYCTSFDGNTLIFDSYDSEVDTTLQQTKTRVFFTEEQVFLIQDEFIIPIPSELSEMYLDAVIAEASVQLRQEPAQEVQRRARAAQIRMQQKFGRIGSKGTKLNYGRNR